MNNSSQVLRDLQDLRKLWKEQNYSYTKEQQEKYNELLALRRAFIDYWKENDMVWVGPSNVGKATTETEQSVA